MVGLIRYLFGYVKIKIISEKPEALLNKLISCGISVWSTERRNDNIILCISLKDFLKIRNIRKGINVKSKVRIIKKYGLKADIKKINFRKSIAVGLVLVLAINVFLSNYIWIIDVNGVQEINKNEIIKECASIGIKDGTLKNKINTYDAAQKIALKFNKIAWVAVNIEGSKLTVNITESEESEKAGEQASNIIASIDGVIKSIKEIKGTKCVDLGQTVKKGDILISGIETVGNNVRYVFSKGEVLAETQRKFKAKVNKRFIVNSLSGETERRNVFEFFGIKIPLYLEGVNESKTSYLDRKCLKFYGVEMPICISTRRFYKYNEVSYNLDKNDALNVAMSMFISDVKNSKILKIMTHDTTVHEDKDSYYFELNVMCLEDIGMTCNIEIPND